MTLSGEIALVTGASRGIGRAIALELARQGAVVVGTATSESGSNNISNYLKDNDVKGHGEVLDVNDPIAVDRVLDAMRAGLGAPTILVNNAGVTRDDLVLRMKDEDWDVVVDTNLKSAFRIARACLRGMIKARKGRVINISSVVGSTGNPGQANYVAAKSGLEGLTRAIAREVAPRNVTVNAVAPGFVDTDMTRSLPDKHREALLGQIPLARLGAPEDIAAAVAFLASPAAGYITGATLHVNGGMYMG
jgi:3-oxoacyl-[acyl-carrier protein] reductase